MATTSSSTSGGIGEGGIGQGIDGARPKITLFVDTVSPFAYVAYYILRVCYGFLFHSYF